MITSFKNFGVLSPERVEITSGEQVYKYLAFKDVSGVEWQNLVAEFGPFDYYIAVDAEKRICSMEADPDASQIGGMEIIGLKVTGDFHWTRGPGGSVYGKVWNGAAIVEPAPEPIPIPNEISRRQFFQQLSNMEIISRVEALAAIQSGALPAPLQTIIDSLPTEDDKFDALMLVSGAQDFNRTHPLAEIVRQAMQWTVEQKDSFWRDAVKL